MSGWGNSDNATGGEKKKGSGGGDGCRKCGEDGHFARDCPSGGAGGGGGDNSCRKCGEEGHFSKECPNAPADTCFKCKKEGHMASECELPDVCRKCKGEGHMAKDCELPDVCYKCKKEGHMASECELPDVCRKCKEEGHQTKDCELPDVCFKCKQEGHMAKDCELPDVCRRCGEEGHMQRDCEKEEATRQYEDKDGVIQECYVPAESGAEQLYENIISTGINFSKYEKIPVKVTGENAPPGIKSFQSAGLRQIILDNIAKGDYKQPTPVQKRTIPVIMSGRDLMACAQTGSGKTASFLLPIISQLIESQADPNTGASVQMPQCVVITPTRELAIQIKDEARRFAMGSMIKPVVAYGGTSVSYNLTQLRKGCNILICTPGRLLQFVDAGQVSFDSLKYLVLDEADRMLEMGFMPDIKRCMESSSMPDKKERQTLMFSATFPDSIQETAQEFMGESYIFVTVGIVGGACSDVTQEFHQVSKYDKREKLKEIISENDPRDKTLVFVKTKKNADFIATHLSSESIPTTSIHGDRKQREREEALYDFRTGKMPNLVATAVAARGLDIKGVAHVINFDMPEEIEEYVHRIGRTGRLGNLGKATSFFDPEEDGDIASPLLKILADCGADVPDWLIEAGSMGGGGNSGGGGGNNAVEDDDDEW